MRTLGVVSSSLNPDQVPAGYAFFDPFSSGLSKWTASRANSQVFTTNAQDVAYCMDFTPALLDNVMVPDDVVIADGKLWMGCGAQNYGDTMLRCNQPFNMATTNVIELEVSLQANPGGLMGWRHIVMSSLPYTAPSAKSDNSSGPTPQYGFGVRFDFGNFGTGQMYPQAFVWNNHAETIINPTSFPTVDISLTSYDMTLVRLEWSATNLTCYANGDLWYSKAWSLPTGITSGQGWLYLGCHNHATVKTTVANSLPIVYNSVAVWDNVKVNGTTLAPRQVSKVPDNIQDLAEGGEMGGFGKTIGWTCPVTVTIPGVPNPAGLASARLLLSMKTTAVSMSSSTRMEWALNGGTVHSEIFPEWTGSSTNNTGQTIWSLPVTLSELVTGNNSVSFAVTNIGGYPRTVANVQLMTEAA